MYRAQVAQVEPQIRAFAHRDHVVDLAGQQAAGDAVVAGVKRDR